MRLDEDRKKTMTMEEEKKDNEWKIRSEVRRSSRKPTSRS